MDQVPPPCLPGCRPHDEVADPAHGATGPDVGFPGGQLLSALLEQADRLMEKLGYRPLRPGP